MSDSARRQMTLEEEMAFEPQAEYDLSHAVRNPYPARARARAAASKAAEEGKILVVIEPELFDKFPSSEAVNGALRSLLGTRQKKDAA